MNRYLLMGCVAGKAPRKAPACELYRSGLWSMRWEYAELSGHPWGILSAKYGVVLPEDVIKPYEQTMSATTKSPRRLSGWRKRIVRGLLRLVETCPRTIPGRDLDFGEQPVPCVIELHAGREYVEAFRWALRCEYFDELVEVETPLAGMGIGAQRGWYAKQRRVRETGQLCLVL